MKRLHIEKLGKGPACFVLHGGPGMDSSYFRPFLDPLSERLSLVFIDARGCGRSERLDPSQYTMDGMIEDIERLRRDEGQEKIFLFGHSFGGFVALHYSLRFADRVRGLILVSTAADTSFSAELQKSIERSPDVVKAQQRYLRSQRADDDFKRFLLGNIPVNFVDPERCRAHDVIARIRPSAACFEQMKLTDLKRYSVVHRLQDIHVPALVIAGEGDLVVPPAYTKKLADGIAGSTFATIPRAGHFPFIENQQEFVRAVEEWLNL